MATRIFHPQTLSANSTTQLTDSAAGHVSRVLRMNTGDTLHLFDGNGGYFEAIIAEISKKSVSVNVGDFIANCTESPLRVHIGQGISRGEKMDFTIQKATELGVCEITPLITERCGVKLQEDRWQKKLDHWQQVAISACEQCGRNIVPQIHPPISLQNWLTQATNELKLNLHPSAKHGINGLAAPQNGVRLLIGSEGGLSDNEIQQAAQNGFESILLGKRVLRTETAALTALAALQTRFGDLG